MNLFLVLKREFSYCTKNKGLLTTTLLMPSLLALLLCALYYNQGVRDVPVAILDLDKTSISRDLVSTSISSSPIFNVVAHPQSLLEAENLMREYKIQAVFSIPKDFEKDIKKGKPVKIGVIANSSNIIFSSMILTKANELIANLSGQVESLVKLNFMPRKYVVNYVQPIKDNFHFLNNPAYNSNYALFLVFGMLLNGLMVMFLFYPTRGLFREIKDIYTKDHVNSITLNPLTVLFGKTLAYLAVLLPGALMGLFLGILVLKIPFNTNFFTLSFYTLWFAVICIWIGMIMPMLFNNQEVGFTMAAITFMPSFVVCGFTWPTYMMIEPLRIYSEFLPFKYFAFLMREVCYGKAINYNLTTYNVGLLVWTIFSFLLAFIMTLIMLKKETRNK